MELRFDPVEVILAILLLQFVGIPFALLFGRIPSPDEPNRAVFLAFVLWNLVTLPLVGLVASQTLPAETVGAPPPAFETTADAVGEGTYAASSTAVSLVGSWTTVSAAQVEEATRGITDVAGVVVPTALAIGLVAAAAAIVSWLAGTRTKARSAWPIISLAAISVLALLLAALGQLVLLTAVDPIPYAAGPSADSFYEFTYNGTDVEITHSTGPDHGKWGVFIDGQPVVEDDEVVTIDGYSDTLRYGVRTEVSFAEAGRHTLSVQQVAPNPDSSGTVISLGELEVLPAARQSDLGSILALLLIVEVVGVALSALFGRALLSSLAAKMTTKRTILLSLLTYTVIVVWGFFLDSSIEFWFLAWMVAVVQGGSQALSRSLYASMAPAAESGEFFGFFSVMAKFSAIAGPMIFAAAVAVFGSSRPAILSVIAFFVIGMILLQRVDVNEGRRVAQEADAALGKDDPDTMEGS